MATDTIIAFLARSEERNNHLISDIKVCHILALFDNGADKFMAADEFRGTFQMTTIDMKVRPLPELRQMAGRDRDRDNLRRAP